MRTPKEIMPIAKTKHVSKPFSEEGGRKQHDVNVLSYHREDGRKD